ncbi:MAG TPA: AraC family transcriptional regulator [Gemmatimonadaceae bacterium]
MAHGQFFAWNGGALFLGSGAGVVPMHAHYAIQLAFGDRPGICFRTGDDAPWVEYVGAMIPSHQPHSMDPTRVAMSAVLFVEPETPEGRALAERHLREGIAPMPEADVAAHIPALFEAWIGNAGADAVQRAAWQVIHALTGGVQPSTPVDDRVLRAIAWMNAHLGESITLEQVAAEAFLSPSRFRHRFVEETGMGLRPYLLWRRLLRVFELATTGRSLSEAAHLAGFADAAHLTRTCRRMFGMAPSALQVTTPPPRTVPSLPMAPVRAPTPRG